MRLRVFPEWVGRCWKLKQKGAGTGGEGNRGGRCRIKPLHQGEGVVNLISSSGISWQGWSSGKKNAGGNEVGGREAAGRQGRQMLT